MRHSSRLLPCFFALVAMHCSYSDIGTGLLLPLPAASGDELAAQVLIRRDGYGVPHILAETEEAVAFGYGFATAEDHILTVARLYLRARAKEAAFFGPEFAESDFRTKHMRVHEAAAEGYARTAPWFQRILDGYAAGYSRHVAKNRSQLPDWVQPVTGIDVLAHARNVMHIGFALNRQALRQLTAPPSNGRGGPTNADDEALAGSNTWAIGRERSASGNALLLGNPHLTWTPGNQTFHEAHLTVPGRLDFSGTTLIGLPWMILGFNDRLGWSHTVNPHDGDDFYELSLTGPDSRSYLYDGAPVALQSRTVTVQVKVNGQLETQERELYSSHHGPVMAIRGDKGYAWRSPIWDESRLMEQWFLMTKARTLREFRRVLDMQALPMFNIAYADVEGNCFYIFNGRMPDRPQGIDWSGVVPGNTSGTEWSDILPQSRLPQLLNPKGAYVQNSNSAPWYTNQQAVIDKSLFPAELAPDSNSLRTQNGLRMLESDSSISLHELMAYKVNMRILLADRIKQDLIGLARGKTVDSVDLSDAAQVLAKWDNTVSRESRGSVLFSAFANRYLRSSRQPFAEPWRADQFASTPRGIGDPDTALRVLAESVRDVQQWYGALDVAYGEVYRLRRGSVDVPIGGASGRLGAFRVINFRGPGPDHKYVAAGGDSYVFAVEFTSPPTAYSIVGYSQSEDPSSPHYADQSVLFAREEWKRAWFSEADVTAHTKRSYRP